jgi:hypothetical protein
MSALRPCLLTIRSGTHRARHLGTFLYLAKRQLLPLIAVPVSWRPGVHLGCLPRQRPGQTRRATLSLG